MGFVVKEGGEPRELVTPDVHSAIIAEVVDLGLEDDRFNPGQKKHKGKAIIQIDEPKTTGKGAGERKELHYFFTATLGTAQKPSNLRKMVEGVRGRQLSSEEVKGFDVMGLAETPCRVVVKHKVKEDGSVGDYVSEFLKPGPSLLELENYKPYAQRQQNGAVNQSATTEEVPF